MTPHSNDVTGQLCVDIRTRDWCKFPYPGHPDGCPNYGTRAGCPPIAPLVQDFIDLGQPHWFMIVEFDLRLHKERMWEHHPNWSERQASCVLYYQGGINKALREGIATFQRDHPGTISTLKPEAMGINVIKTLRRIGVVIEVKPKAIVTKVALLGYPVIKD